MPEDNSVSQGLLAQASRLSEDDQQTPPEPEPKSKPEVNQQPEDEVVKPKKWFNFLRDENDKINKVKAVAVAILVLFIMFAVYSVIKGDDKLPEPEPQTQPEPELEPQPEPELVIEEDDPQKAAIEHFRERQHRAKLGCSMHERKTMINRHQAKTHQGHVDPRARHRYIKSSVDKREVKVVNDGSNGHTRAMIYHKPEDQPEQESVNRITADVLATERSTEIALERRDPHQIEEDPVW